MAFCKNCGTELTPGAAVCDRCGAPAESGARPYEGQPYMSSGQSAATYDPSDKRLLRILSVLVAAALLVFFAGLAGRIYTGRVVDEFYKDSEYGLDSFDRRDEIQALAASVRGDARGVLSIRSARYQVDFSESDVAEEKEELRVLNEAGSKEYGFRWTLLQLAGYYSIMMWIGGTAELICLALWIVKGGRLRNLPETCAFLPAAILIAVGLIFLAIFVAISPDFSKVF